MKPKEFAKVFTVLFIASLVSSANGQCPKYTENKHSVCIVEYRVSIKNGSKDIDRSAPMFIRGSKPLEVCEERASEFAKEDSQRGMLDPSSANVYNFRLTSCGKDVAKPELGCKNGSEEWWKMRDDCFLKCNQNGDDMLKGSGEINCYKQCMRRNGCEA